MYSITIASVISNPRLVLPLVTEMVLRTPDPLHMCGGSGQPSVLYRQPLNKD